MSFIKKIKGPDEKLLGIAYIHWIYGFQGILWLAGLMFFGTLINNYTAGLFSGFRDNIGYRAVTGFSDIIFWICTGTGLILFLFYVLMIATTEVGLTDKRVIYKRGFIFVKTVEIDIEEIKGASVNNGILGRILNYGYVMLDARFVENLNLPALADPYRFVKALNEMRSKLKQDSMQIVIEGSIGGEAKAPEAKSQHEHDSGSQKKAKPAHLYDKRYKALSNDPLDAVTDFVEDTIEELQQASHVVERQNPHHANAETAREIDPQTSKPVKVPRGLFAKKPPKEEGGEPLYKKPSKKLRPIIFRQERMRQDIKDSFSENTAP